MKMTTRVIDNDAGRGGSCPVCNADKAQIKKITPDPIAHAEIFFYQCEVCGYDESQQDVFPSHEA
jgi:rubredoxin